MSREPEEGDDGDNGEGHIDEFDESIDFGPKDLITIEGDDGEPVQCAILMVIQHDTEEYALLGRVEDLVDQEREDIEMYICHYSVDASGNRRVAPIEDEATYEAVRQAFELL